MERPEEPINMACRVYNDANQFIATIQLYPADVLNAVSSWLEEDALQYSDDQDAANVHTVAKLIRENA